MQVQCLTVIVGVSSVEQSDDTLIKIKIFVGNLWSLDERAVNFLVLLHLNGRS